MEFVAAIRDDRSPRAPPDFAQLDPAAIWEWIAADLATAVESARHPFHLMHLATVGLDRHPGVRTVVLRRFIDGARDGGGSAWFHTDSRSPKVEEIRRTPAVTLLGYDPERRLQLRIPAKAVVHHQDAEALEAWRRSRPMSRACYGSAVAPGTVLDSFPAAPAVPGDDDDAGFAHFAAVDCLFDSLELLELASGGHRRMVISLARTGVSRRIVAP